MSVVDHIKVRPYQLEIDRVEDVSEQLPGTLGGSRVTFNKIPADQSRTITIVSRYTIGLSPVYGHMLTRLLERFLRQPIIEKTLIEIEHSIKGLLHQAEMENAIELFMIPDGYYVINADPLYPYY